eukprot:13600583-Alexandrium_andersonii.AAC.1
MRKTQNRFRRSNLELRGPNNGLRIGARSSGGVRSAPFCALIPNLPTKAGLEGVRGPEIETQRTPIRNPPIRNPRKPSLLARGRPGYYPF